MKLFKVKKSFAGTFAYPRNCLVKKVLCLRYWRVEIEMIESSNKEKYRSLCQDEPSIHLFNLDWWLDVVCTDGFWDVALVEKNGEIVAAMPYYVRKQLSVSIITMPKFTQNMGPWFAEMNGKYTRCLSRQMDMMDQLINQLPRVDMFLQSFHPKTTNWLPFYWKKYLQSTSYTYVIDNISSPDDVLSGFQSSKKQDVKKAQKQGIKVSLELTPEEYYENHKLTLSKQGAKISYSKELLVSLAKAAYKHNACQIFQARDSFGNIHAAFFIVWADQRAYLLSTSIDPEYRSSGAGALLTFEVIRFLSESGMVTSFDFEGSMIQGVEKSYRHFGSRQVPYFQIRKSNWKGRLICEKALQIKKWFSRKGQ